MTLTTPKTLHISIIIPTLNEENNLGRLLTFLQEYQGVDIIVADGGSTDQTLNIARDHCVKIVTSPAGRGLQQNEGAKHASEKILLFLHGDTRLPDNFLTLIQTVLDKRETVCGAFLLHIDAIGTVYRLIEWGANVRTRLAGLPYGDQALFIRKKDFAQVGGFPEQPLLEDLELVRRLKRLGRIGIVSASVTTSARRWQQLGPLRSTLFNQAILLGYLFGIQPEKLWRWYYKTVLRTDK